jgi:hypothetical protein
MVQELFNERIWKVGRAIEPLNASAREFLLNLCRTSRVHAMVGMAPESGDSRLPAGLVSCLRTKREEDDQDPERAN